MVDDSFRLVDLVHQQYGRLVGTIGLSCPSEVSAEDIAQEAVLRLCRHWPRVSRHDQPEAWLYRVAFNLVAAERGRLQRQHRLTAMLARTPEPTDKQLDTSADSGPIRAAVCALPDRQRQAILCRFYLDLSVADTASIMRCAQGTVRALTAQAMTRLRNWQTGDDRPQVKTGAGNDHR